VEGKNIPQKIKEEGYLDWSHLASELPSKTRYKGADKSLARPTSGCIFLMMRIFSLMLVLLYILIFLQL